MSFSTFSDDAATGVIKQPKLPYEENALEPAMGAKTVNIHYGKHHKAYVDKINVLLKDSPLKGKSLEEIILASAGKEDSTAMINAAGQVWAHNFFWKSMKPTGGGEPKGKLLELINKSFGSYAEFKKKFVDDGVRVYRFASLMEHHYAIKKLAILLCFKVVSIESMPRIFNAPFARSQPIQNHLFVQLWCRGF